LLGYSSIRITEKHYAPWIDARVLSEYAQKDEARAVCRKRLPKYWKQFMDLLDDDESPQNTLPRLAKETITDPS